MNEKPRALVMRTAGTNCDAELVRAFTLAGCDVDLLHVDRLAADPTPIDRADVIGFPGGFSYGDDIASGRILAARLRETVWGNLRDSAARGTPMIGICNGFQVMVQLGLLPGPDAGEAWGEGRIEPTVALAENSGGRFIDRWVGVAPAVDSGGENCIWTKGLAEGLASGVYDEATMMLPIAHGEGRVVAKDGAMLARSRPGAGGRCGTRNP